MPHIYNYRLFTLTPATLPKGAKSHHRSRSLTFEHLDDDHEIFVDEERPGQVTLGPYHRYDRLLGRGLFDGGTCQWGTVC